MSEPEVAKRFAPVDASGMFVLARVFVLCPVLLIGFGAGSLSAQETGAAPAVGDFLSLTGAPDLAKAVPVKATGEAGALHQLPGLEGVDFVGWRLEEKPEGSLVLNPAGRLLFFAAGESAPADWNGADALVNGVALEVAEQKDVLAALMAGWNGVPAGQKALWGEEEVSVWMLLAMQWERLGFVDEAKKIEQELQPIVAAPDTPASLGRDRWLRWQTARAMQRWSATGDWAVLASDLSKLQDHWPRTRRSRLVFLETLARAKEAFSPEQVKDLPLWFSLGITEWRGRDASGALALWGVNLGLARLVDNRPSWEHPWLSKGEPLEAGGRVIPWIRSGEEVAVPEPVDAFWAKPIQALEILSQMAEQEALGRLSGYARDWEPSLPRLDHPLAVPGFGLMPLRAKEVARESLSGLLPPGVSTPEGKMPTWKEQIQGLKERLADDVLANALFYLASEPHGEAMARLLCDRGEAAVRVPLEEWILRSPEKRFGFIGPRFRLGVSEEFVARLSEELATSDPSWEYGSTLGYLLRHRRWLADLGEPETAVDAFLQGGMDLTSFDRFLLGFRATGHPYFVVGEGRGPWLARAVSRTDQPDQRAALLLRSLPVMVPSHWKWRAGDGIGIGGDLRRLLEDKRPVALTAWPHATVAGFTALLAHDLADQRGEAARILTFADPEAWMVLVDRARLLLDGKTPPPLPEPTAEQGKELLEKWTRSSAVERANLVATYDLKSRLWLMDQQVAEPGATGAGRFPQPIVSIRLATEYAELQPQIKPWLNRMMGPETWQDLAPFARELQVAHPELVVGLYEAPLGTGLVLILFSIHEVFPEELLLATMGENAVGAGKENTGLLTLGRHPLPQFAWDSAFASTLMPETEAHLRMTVSPESQARTPAEFSGLWTKAEKNSPLAGPFQLLFWPVPAGALIPNRGQNE
jgi:hypothetical protein